MLYSILEAYFFADLCLITGWLNFVKLEINSRKRSEYNTYNDVSLQVASTKIARAAAADANLEVFRRVS